MPRLYIANCTPQHREFSYRLLGAQQVHTWTIKPGEQVIASGNLAREQLANAIEQNEQYGLHAAREVSQAQDYVNLLWEFDKPVSSEQMRKALERNLRLKTLEGEKTRKAVAVGMTQVVERENPDVYTGLRVSVEDKGGTDITLNEIHTHRRDGQYERGTDFEAPLNARRAPRRRKAA